SSDGERLWVPIRDGVERVGVLLLAADSFDDALVEGCRLVATLLAQLLVSKLQYGDSLQRAQRRGHEMSLAAEVRWMILPPLSFATGRLSIACSLEPAYDVAGDAFDYAMDDGVLRFAVF